MYVVLFVYSTLCTLLLHFNHEILIITENSILFRHSWMKLDSVTETGIHNSGSMVHGCMWPRSASYHHLMTQQHMARRNVGVPKIAHRIGSRSALQKSQSCRCRSSQRLQKEEALTWEERINLCSRLTDDPCRSVPYGFPLWLYNH